MRYKTHTNALFLDSLMSCRYYINMDQDTDRRALMERWWGQVWDLRRHVGFDPRDPQARVKMLGRLHEAEIMRAIDRSAAVSADLADYDTYDNHRRNRLMELGPTIAHLTAIKRAYDEGHKKAIIMEDDVTPYLVPYWRKSPKDLVALMDRQHPSWHILQLTYVDQIQRQANKTAEGFFEIHRFRFGAAAYAISRAGMEEVLSLFLTPEGTFRLPVTSLNILIDVSVLNQVSSTFVASPALFTTNWGVASTIGSDVSGHAVTQKRHWVESVIALRTAHTLSPDLLGDEIHKEELRVGHLMGNLFPNLYLTDLTLDFPV